MLINEYYKITTNLTNNHDSDLDNAQIIVSLPTSLLNKVFLTAEAPSTSSKLSSRIQIDVGAMKGRASATISYFITSLIEGNIELKQSLCYQTEDKSTVDDLSTFNQVTTPTDSSINTLEKSFADKEDQHDIVVEYLDNNLVRKKRDDIIIIPCVEEFGFESKFYTLNRKPATSCFKDEEIIMRCTLKMSSPFALNIVDAFFIADVNVDELRNQNRNFIKNSEKQGAEIENILILRPNCTSSDWITKTFKKPVNDDASKLFDAKSLDVQRKEQSVKEIVKENEDDPFVLKSKDQKLNYANSGDVSKTIINSALGVTELVEGGDKKKGFINAKLNLLDTKAFDPSRKFGLYCIKWKKSESDIVNESKFAIKGIGEFHCKC